MRLSGWQLPVEHLSASSIALGIQCPEKFRLRHVKKNYESMFVPRFLGLVDHAAHAENFRQKIQSGTDFDSNLMRGIYGREWDRLVLKEEPLWEGEDPQELQRKGIEMLDLYHEQVSPMVKPVAVEERFEIKVREVPVPIIGYIDVIQATKATERKASTKKMTKPKPDWRFQARLYQLATDLPTEWHVVTKQVTPQIFTPETKDCEGLFMEKQNPDATVAMIQQAAYRLNDLYIKYGPDTPWPPDGQFHDWLCGYCGFGPKHKNICPAWT